MAALALASGLLLSFLPLPAFDFSPVSALSLETPDALAPVSPESLAEQQAVADEPLEVARVHAVEESVASFDTIAVLLDDVPAEPVMLRTSDDAGRWSEWREVGLEEDEAPDADSAEARSADGRVGTEPIWVGDASGYEITLPEAAGSGAEVALVREEMQRSVVEATPMADAALPRPFDINSRASWGARASSVSSASTIRLAVVHHSASSNDYTQAQVPAILRSTQAYHMDGRGWSDLAYNFVVDKFGTIWEGRGGGIDNPVIGAHAMGFNTGSVGVMVLGDYTQAQPSAAAIESVSQVVGWKLAMHGVDPLGRADITSGGSTSIPAGRVVNLPRVVGHQEVGSTSCPGSIQGRLPQIRERGQAWTNLVRALSTPVGAVDGVGVSPGVVSAVGWAFDPDASSTMQVRMTVGGVTATAPTGGWRPDVGAVHPAAGNSSGYSISASGVPPGYHDMCITAVNQNYGTGDVNLLCRPVIVPDPSGLAPVGTLSAQGGTGDVMVTGTATAPRGMASVTAEIDGIERTTVPAGNGSFAVRTVGVLNGSHRVCIIGADTAGLRSRINCQVVTVRGAQSIGSVDRIERSGSNVYVSGWTLDPESVDPIPIAVSVGGRRLGYLAAASRPDIAAAFPGYGDRHGYEVSIPVGVGNHRVCVEHGGVGSGEGVLARCADVVVK